MKTKNLLIGLGIAAGALLAFTAVNKKTTRNVKEFVAKKINKNSPKAKVNDNENIYA